jgi:hypothetical protein
MIVQTVTNSFKSDILQGLQNLLTDNLYLALYTANANLNANTTAYNASNEVSSANYTAGGQLVTGVTIQTDTQSNIVYVSFNNVTWTNVSFVCRGALLYNASKSNKSIAILNWGSDKNAGPNFTVTLPADTPTNALIRV